MLVTVGIPVYKEKYFREALTSVVSQKYENLEIIILNDCSPYDIDSIIRDFDDKRIKYYKNDINIGGKNLVEVWNKVLSYSNGDLFVLFSDDDVYELNFVEEIVRFANQYPNTNVFRTLVKIIDGDNKLIRKTECVPAFETAHDYLLNRILGKRYHFMPDIVFRTDRLKQTNFIKFPLAWYSDEATCFIQALDGGIVTVNDYLVKWRYSDSNISSVGNLDQRIQAGIDYHKWLTDVIFEIFSDKDTILLLNRKRVEQNKKNVIIRTARRNIALGVFDIIKNGVIVRNKYKMSYLQIILSALSFIKNYSRGNN